MRNKSDVFPLEFNKQKNKTKLVIKIKDEILKLEVRNINIYNILSSLALLKQLKLDLNKCIKTFKKHKPSEGRG